MATLLSVTDAAALVGASQSLVQKRCKDGSLPCIRVGKSYRIAQADLEAWVKFSPITQNKAALQACSDDLFKLVEAWLCHIQTIQGVSPETYRSYRGLTRQYLRRLTGVLAKGPGLRELYERGNLTRVFSQIPVESFSTRMNMYLALGSLGKFLVQEGKLDEGRLASLSVVRPRKVKEARRTHLKEADVQRLFDAVQMRQRPQRENLAYAAAFALMVYVQTRPGTP